ncbi:MAG: Gfo/Idh/MocA family oxidoreductase [Flavobacteriaceae bacterium]|nr:Gfo/Idh/MocA family oxidoreductase [Flavobacteriaceae bacterium]
MKKLKIGVLGAGHLGKIHLRLLKESEFYDLVGFFDSDKNTANELAKKEGYVAFESIEKLLSEVEVVDIVTPTPYHHEMAVICLKAKKHIFIEKPITQTVIQAEEIVQLAKENKLQGQVGHVERFNPAFKAVKEHIDKPMFIETHRLAEFNPRGTDVPVILDLMIHDIDIILSVVNSPVINVSSSGVSVISETPDIANARIEFENGCVANLTASRISLKNMRKTRFFQKEAYISIDFLTKQVEVVKMKDAPKKPEEFDLILQNAEGVKKQIYFEPPKIEESNAILEELNTFAQAIQNNTEPIVTLKHATEALKVAHQIIGCFK